MELHKDISLVSTKFMSKNKHADSSLGDACNGTWDFKAVGDDDEVWDKFLPSDYYEILARALDSPGAVTKKHAFLLLSGSPVLLDHGKLSFMLNKGGGEKCYMLSARELSIAWIDTPYFWRWTSLPESRFSEVAELQCVCWLEIRGKIATRMLSNKTNYSAYLVFKAKTECFGLDYASESIVKFIGAREGEGEVGEVRAVHVVPPKVTHGRAGHNIGQADSQVTKENVRLPCKRRDGWMEIELGEFYNDHGNDNNAEVEAALVATKMQNWKGGLIIEGIEFRPKGMHI
ncbi:putative F-box protein PP2-B12 [Apium graveolens]|uniref:putative F-box protein PP2-B12 n=1 Tax=Apium graveolens TaxID=4045 RepID=UPI003D7AF549